MLLTGVALFPSVETVKILKAPGLVDRDRETAQDSYVYLQKISPPMIIEGKGSSESPILSIVASLIVCIRRADNDEYKYGKISGLAATQPRPGSRSRLVLYVLVHLSILHSLQTTIERKVIRHMRLVLDDQHNIFCQQQGLDRKYHFLFLQIIPIAESLRQFSTQKHE